MIKNLIHFLLLVIFSLNAFAQEKLFPLRYNQQCFDEISSSNKMSWYPSAILGIPDTLELPFEDDFSGNFFPDYFFYSYLPENKGGEIFYSHKINGLPPASEQIEYSREPTAIYDSTQTPVLITPKTSFTISFYNKLNVYPASPFVADSTITVYPPTNTFIQSNGIDFESPSASVFTDFLEVDSIYFIKLKEKNALWFDQKKTVYQNRDLAINPPTLGVVTFDGLNEKGMPYNAVSPNSYGIADVLTSKPINLNYSTNPGVWMMFFYQPKGRGNAPEFADSIRLEFRTPDNNWQRVWSRTGFEPGNDTNFRKVVININNIDFLKTGFQFRFKNYSTLSGNFDHWNIDYIKITADANDTIIKDMAFVYRPKSFIRPYTSMPFNQYRAANMAVNANNFLRNLSNNDINISYRFRITDFDETNEFNAFDVDNINFLADQVNNCELCVRVLNPMNNLGYQFPEMSSCTEYKIKQYIQPLSISSNLQNDTITHLQQFAEYFSYDDGTAEAAYGIENSPNSEVLVAFELAQAAVCKALNIHFTPSINDVSFQDFSIVIRTIGNDGFPGDVIFEQPNFTGQFSSSRNGFVTYPLFNPPEIQAGKFYIGIKNYVDASINIGFDANINNYDKIFIKELNNSWYNTQFQGSLMLRPVFEECANGLPSHTFGNNKTNNLAVYPNPASSFISIPEGRFEIIDISGKIVLNGLNYSLSTVNISELNNGMYFIKLYHQNEIHNIKFIKTDL